MSHLAIHLMSPFIIILFFLPTSLKGFVGSHICQVRNENARVVSDCRSRGIAHINIRFYTETEVLDLSDNEIDILRNYEFKELEVTNLLELVLRKNSIEEVGKLAFDGLNLLTNLDLSHNRIKALPENVFTTNRRLTVLKLSNNPLKQTQPLGTFQLQALDVSFCSFTKIPLDIIKKPQLLFNLNIADNSIREIAIADIAPAENLQFLSLGNSITCNTNAEQLITWLTDMGVEFTPFCSSHRNLKATPQTESRRVFIPLADDANYPKDKISDCPPGEEPPWYEHWGFKLVIIGKLGLILILLLILLCLVIGKKKINSNQWKTGEELPPYI